MKRRVISFLLALCMMLSLLPTAAFGAEDDCDDCVSEGYPLADKTDEDTVPEAVEPASHFTILRSDIDTAAFVEPAVPVLQGITYTDAERPTTFRRSAPAYTTDISAAAELLRECMKAHENEIHVYYQINIDGSENLEDVAASAVTDIYNQALKHTGVGNEGDYLRWSIHSVGQNVNIQQDGNVCFLDATYYLSYYTTAAQEDELIAAIEELKPLLRLDEDIPDYQKLTNIYHYICSYIIYDYEHVWDDEYLLQQSAYAALIHKTAVCQGYATLLYFLALEAGIDCRILVGESQGMGHAWNVAQIDGLYYFLDSTWDAGTTDFQYFLKSRQDFPDHAEYLELLEEDFYAKHPIASASYVHPEIPLQKEGAFEYSVSAGLATLVKYTGSEKDVVVPAYLGGYPVYQIGSQVFVGNGTMESLTFSEGIAFISSESIMTCTSLKTLYIPSTMRFVSYDGPAIITGLASVPLNCYQLREVVVAEGNPYITVYDGVLYSPDMTELIFLPPADPRETLRIPEGVLKIGSHACRDNANLREVIMPDTVQIIGYWSFIDDYNLEKINISKSCVLIGQYTLQNTAISSIHIPAALTNILYGALVNNSYLKTISVDPQNPMYYAEDNVLYGWYNTGNLQLIEYPAGSDQTHFDVPDGVHTISWFAFDSAKNLKSVWLPDSVQIIDYAAFDNCSNLEKIRFSENLKTIEESAFFSCYCLASVHFPMGLTKIGKHAFANVNLACLVIPDTLQSIGEYAFSPTHYNLHHILYSGTADQWESISIESGNDTLREAIRHDEYANSYTAEAVRLRNSCTLVEVSCDICDKQFAIHNGSPSASAHQFSNGICNVCQVPQGFEYTINDDSFSVTISGYYGNTASVEIPATIEGLPVVAVSNNVFANHTEITEVYLPDSIQSLDWQVFYGCTGLKRIHLPESLRYIGQSAFGLCNGLEELILPKSLTTIAPWAFSHWKNPGNVIFTGDAPAFSNGVFNETVATVYYPCGNKTWTADKLQDYGGKLNWKVYHTFENGVCTDCGAADPDYVPLTVEAATSIAYTVSGNTVTVTHDAACKVGYLVDDAYVKIDAIANGDGSYRFEVPAGITDVLLVVNGDVNGDGKITGVDKGQLNAAVLGKVTLSAEGLFGADVSNDGRLTGVDKGQLNAVILGKTAFGW